MLAWLDDPVKEVKVQCFKHGFMHLFQVLEAAVKAIFNAARIRKGRPFFPPSGPVTCLLAHVSFDGHLKRILFLASCIFGLGSSIS